jgi:hypothetical protein
MAKSHPQEVTTAQEQFSGVFAEWYPISRLPFFDDPLDEALIRSAFGSNNVSLFVFCYASKVTFVHFYSIVHWFCICTMIKACPQISSAVQCYVRRKSPTILLKIASFGHGIEQVTRIIMCKWTHTETEAYHSILHLVYFHIPSNLRVEWHPEVREIVHIERIVYLSPTKAERERSSISFILSQKQCHFKQRWLVSERKYLSNEIKEQTKIFIFTSWWAVSREIQLKWIFPLSHRWNWSRYRPDLGWSDRAEYVSRSPISVPSMFQAYSKPPCEEDYGLTMSPHFLSFPPKLRENRGKFIVEQKWMAHEAGEYLLFSANW